MKNCSVEIRKCVNVLALCLAYIIDQKLCKSIRYIGCSSDPVFNWTCAVHSKEFHEIKDRVTILKTDNPFMDSFSLKTHAFDHPMYEDHLRDGIETYLKTGEL